MALDAAAVRQAGDELVADEGVQLVWFPFFTRRCFRFSTFIVKSKLVCWIVASSGSDLLELRFADFLVAAAVCRSSP